MNDCLMFGRCLYTHTHTGVCPRTGVATPMRTIVVSMLLNDAMIDRRMIYFKGVWIRGRGNCFLSVALPLGWPGKHLAQLALSYTSKKLRLWIDP